MGRGCHIGPMGGQSKGRERGTHVNSSSFLQFTLNFTEEEDSILCQTRFQVKKKKLAFMTREYPTELTNG